MPHGSLSLSASSTTFNFTNCISVSLKAASGRAHVSLRFLGCLDTLATLPSRLEQFPSALDVSVTPSDNLFGGHVAHTLSTPQATPAVSEALPSIATLPEKHLKLQRVLSHFVVDAEHAGLLSSANRFTQARLRSAAGSEAIPASRHLSFTNVEFQTAVSLRLGLSIPALRSLPRCTCSTTWDEAGYHALTCQKDGGQTRRHDRLSKHPDDAKWVASSAVSNAT